MAPRAYFDLQFMHGRTRLESVSTRTGNYTAAVFGMNSRFHLASSAFPYSRIGYHPEPRHTIHPGSPARTLLAAAAALILFLGAPVCAGSPPLKPLLPIASQATAPAPGFAPSNRTLFAPLLELAPPGPQRAARAIALLERQFAFQRKIAFHPAWSASLDHVLDELPPRQSTLIRAAALYSDDNVPWIRLPDGEHAIYVTGRPLEHDYLYTSAPKFEPPTEPFRMAAYFTLKPSPEAAKDGDITSVIGKLGGEIQTNTFGAGALVDAGAAVLRETYGDLKPPWDTEPGQFNHHDVAAEERFSRDLPTLWTELNHYLKINNVLDEFDGPGGPYVLVNFKAEVRPEALKPFVHLERFYNRVMTTVTAQSDFTDSHGNYWMRAGFDRGTMWLVMMVRGGMLTPFDASYRPAGAPVAIDKIASATHYARTSLRVRRLGMDFGLDDISFAADYTRRDGALRMESRMNAVPKLVAPPVVHQMARFVAGDFLRTVAEGNGGLRASFSSRAESSGVFDYQAAFTGGFLYSPTLEFLARIGDAIAQANNAAVRADERRLGEELFDAFLKDYNNARPKILALDRNSDLMR
jgi:hypothetical protein